MIPLWKRLLLGGLAGLALGLLIAPSVVRRLDPPPTVAAPRRPIPADSLASAVQSMLVRAYNLSPDWFGRIRPVKLTAAPTGFGRFVRELKIPKDVPVAELIRELNLELKPYGGRAVGRDDIQSHPRVVEVHLIHGGAVRGTLRVIVDGDLSRSAGKMAVVLDGVTGDRAGLALLTQILLVPDPVNLLVESGDPTSAAVLEATRGRADKPVWVKVGWSTERPDRTRPDLVVYASGDSATVRPLVSRYRREFAGAAGVLLPADVDTNQLAARRAVAALGRERIAVRWAEPAAVASPVAASPAADDAVVSALAEAAEEARTSGRRVRRRFALTPEVVAQLSLAVARVARQGFQLTPL